MIFRLLREDGEKDPANSLLGLGCLELLRWPGFSDHALSHHILLPVYFRLSKYFLLDL